MEDQYHFLFKHQVNDTFSTGVNVMSDSIDNALIKFRQEHADKLILAIYTPDLMSLLNRGGK